MLSVSLSNVLISSLAFNWSAIPTRVNSNPSYLNLFLIWRTVCHQYTAIVYCWRRVGFLWQSASNMIECDKKSYCSFSTFSKWKVVRLLRAIYRPHNVYCFHIDAKSSADFHKALTSMMTCFDNVHFATKLERIVYAGYSRLQADINCMSDHLKSTIKWRYLINTAAQAFPLRTNAEMVKILRLYNGANDIEGIYGHR